MSATIAAGEKIRASKITVNKGTYSPSITASGGSITLGTGDFLTGKWRRVGADMTVIIDLSVGGAGSAYSGTSWRITLPYAADLTWHTAGVLGAASDIIGNYQTSSGTSAEALAGSVLLSAASELIFYRTGSTASIGAAQFTSAPRIKAVVHYLADASLF